MRGSSRPVTVDPRDNVVLCGAHAVQKRLGFPHASQSGINEFRTSAKHRASGANRTDLNSRSTTNRQPDKQPGRFVAMGQGAQCKGER
jgi:hypothetical protein